MPRRKINQRNEALMEDFRRLKAKHYETGFVLQQLAKKYFLSTAYLYRIIREEGK